MLFGQGGEDQLGEGEGLSWVRVLGGGGEVGRGKKGGGEWGLE